MQENQKPGQTRILRNLNNRSQSRSDQTRAARKKIYQFLFGVTGDVTGSVGWQARQQSGRIIKRSPEEASVISTVESRVVASAELSHILVSQFLDQSWFLDRPALEDVAWKPQRIPAIFFPRL